MHLREFVPSLVAAAILLTLAAPQARAQQAPAVAPTPAPVAPAATPTPIPAPTPAPSAHRHLLFGLGVDLFSPTNSKTRNRFGGTSIGISPEIGGLRWAITQGRFDYDLHLYYQSSGNNYALWAPVGVEYRKALSDGQKFRPYVGASADLVPNDIRSDPDAVNARLRLAYGGSLFVGAMLGRRRYVEARYFAVSSVAGFNLSTFTLGAGIRF